MQKISQTASHHETMSTDMIYPRSKIAHITICNQASEVASVCRSDKAFIYANNITKESAANKDKYREDWLWFMDIPNELRHWLKGRFAVYISMASLDYKYLAIANAISSIARQKGVWVFCFLDCSMLDEPAYLTLLKDDTFLKLKYHSAVYPFRLYKQNIEKIEGITRASYKTPEEIKEHYLATTLTFDDYLNQHKNYLTLLYQQYSARQRSQAQLTLKDAANMADNNESVRINLNDFLQLHLDGDVFFYLCTFSLPVLDLFIEKISVDATVFMAKLPLSHTINSGIFSLTSKQPLNLSDNTRVFVEMATPITNNTLELPDGQLYDVVIDESTFADFKALTFMALDFSKSVMTPDPVMEDANV